MYNVNLIMKDLAKYLEKTGMTCSEFAKKASVNLSTFSRIKSGDYCPGTKILTKIVNAMGNSIDYYKTSIEGVDGIAAVAETLTVDELITIVEHLQQLRDRKIKEKLTALENDTKMYEQLLKKES